MIATSPDGTPLSYTVRGDGPLSLLFIHGWAGSVGYWDDLLGILDLTGLRAIAYDLRAHGGSGEEGSFTYETVAADAIAVADAAAARQFVVLGFSMGAKFAQYLAGAHPDRIAGLILVAGAPAGEIPLPAEVRHDWSERAGNPARLKEVTAAYVTRPDSEDVLDRWAAAAARVPEQVLDESLRICTDISLADRVSAIRVPTLVVGGVHDPIFPPDVLRHGVQGTIQGARLVLVDSNHEIPIEAPRELAMLISAFIAGMGRH